MSHLLDKTIFLIRFVLTLLIQLAVAAFVGHPNTLLLVAVFMGGALGVAAIWSIDLSLHFRNRANGASRRQPRDDAELIRLIRLVRALDADTTHAPSSHPPDAPHKRKRHVLDDVLRDLSDEQLEILRQRLRDGTIDDAMLQQRMVGADSESIYKETP